jgi:hypothetical protein
LRILEVAKIPFLFHSEDLAKMVDTTLSVRTRISMMATIGPRLVDPKAKTDYFLGLFRYAEEKSQVEDILKARTQTLNSSMYNKMGASESSYRGGLAGGRGGGAGGGGGGGRLGGGAGRGRGRGGGVSSLSNMNSHSGYRSVGEDAILTLASTDSCDNHGGNIVHGAENVYADLDELTKPRRPSMLAALTESSDDEEDAAVTAAAVGAGASMASPSQPTTDNEQSSVSSDDLDKHPRLVEKTSSFDMSAGLSVGQRPMSMNLNSPPMRISASTNPLQQLKRQQQQQQQQQQPQPQGTIKELNSTSRVSINRVPLSTSGWINSNKEDASKSVQAGTVLAKLNTFNFLNVDNRNGNNDYSTPVVTPSKSSYQSHLSKSASAKFSLPLQLPTTPSGSNGGGGAINSVLNGDLASKCAAALKMSRESFLALTPEEPKERSSTGVDLFTYQELVRRNFHKDYEGVSRSELERHLIATEFVSVFEKDQVIVLTTMMCNERQSRSFV